MSSNWKEVFPDLEISSEGGVRYLGIPLSVEKGRGGYAYVTIPLKQHSPVKAAVHRLVARAFLGKSSQRVKHLNGIRDDNRVANLAYASRSDYKRTKKPRNIKPLKKAPNKATPERMREFWKLLRKGVPMEVIAEAIGVSVPTLYRWRQAIGSSKSRWFLRDPRRSFRGCRDGKACGCSCHKEGR